MTRFTRPILGLVLLAGLAAPVRAAEVDPLLPAETEGVVQINFRQILESDLIKKYALEQIKQALQGADAKKMMETVGVDPLKDIDRATISFWGKDPQDMNGVGIIRGKFDPAKLYKAVEEITKKEPEKAEIVTEGTYKMVKVNPEKEGSKPVYISVADEKTIVAGSSAKLVASTLSAAAKAGKPQVKKELAAVILAQDEKASLFMCGLTEGKVDVPPGLNIPGVDGAKLAKQLETMKSFSLTINVTGDVSLEVGMGMKDADSADDFANTVDGLVNTAKTFLPLLAAQQPAFKPLVDEVTKSLKSKVKDTNVTLSLKVTAEAIGMVTGGGQ